MSDIERHLAQLADPALWRGIAPQLHVGDESFRTRTPLAFDDSVLARLRADVAREGYFQLPPQAWGIDVPQVAAGVGAVTAAGHLPVFAFMYDEVWFMFAQIRRLLGGLLGDEYRMMPAFWAWHIDGKRESAGWQPHRDLGHFSLLPDRSPPASGFSMPPGGRLAL